MSDIVQVNLNQRPIAINPITKTMYPDGIFIRSLNGGMALMRVKLPNPYRSIMYASLFSFKNAESPEIIIQNAVAEMWVYVPPGEEYFYWSFRVDLSGASIGKHDVTIRLAYFYTIDPYFSFEPETVEYKGQIYVSDVHLDNSLYGGKAYLPEGEFSLSISGVQLFQDEKIKGKVPCDNKAIKLPKDFLINFDFIPPFSGIHGPYPFTDPLSPKSILGIIIAAIAGTVALGWWLGGELGWWDSPIYHTESGSRDPETGEVCRDCYPGEDYTSVQADPVWGAFVAAAAIGAAMAASGDMSTPFRSGEIASPPDSADKTKLETLSFSLDYKQFPLPGTPFEIGIDWKFQRHGIDRPDYPDVSQRDNIVNIHCLENYTVRTVDGQIEYSRNTTNNIGIEVDLSSSSDFARYKKESGDEQRRLMPEFYVFGFLRHRQTRVTKSAIFTPRAGRHLGYFPISNDDPLGYWDVMVIIQNVNNAAPNMSPDEQAQVVGGFFYSQNFNLQHVTDSRSCIVLPNWDLTIKLVT